MNQQNDKRLEFEEDNAESGASSRSRTSLRSDPQLGKIFRGSYRIPLNKTSSPIAVKIRGREFELVNLMSYGNSGIGIVLQTKELFSVGEELPAIQLIMAAKALTLQGTVRHVSPNGDGFYLCGIEFTRLTREDQQALREYCDWCQAELFGDK